MDQRRYNVCCGADIHKKFLVATTLLMDGMKLTKRFSMDLRSLFEFRDWINANGYEVVAVESTGSYWVLIYRVLEGHVELIVATTPIKSRMYQAGKRIRSILSGSPNSVATVRSCLQGYFRKIPGI